MSHSRVSDREKSKIRLVSFVGLMLAALTLHFYLFDFVQAFLNGEMESIFGGDTIDKTVTLYLMNAGFAMFSLIITYLTRLVFPTTAISEGLMEEVVDEKLLEGVIVFGIVLPLYEEVKFRLAPYIVISIIFYFFGNTGLWHWLAVAVAVLSTVSWVLAHGLRTLIIAPLGIFYGFMLWNGLLVEAFIIHFLYNTTLVIVSKIL